MKKLSILLLEDNEFDAELNKAELQMHLQEYECAFQWVANKADYLTLLNAFKPDLVLSDYNLPSYTGLEALRDFKVKFPVTPFIFVTGTQQEEVAANAIKEGAWDYVVKDRLTRLSMAVQNALKLREEQLKNSKILGDVAKSELLLRTLYNTASDAIFMMQGPLFVDCNVATEKIFGCSRDQIVGQTPIKFSPPFQSSGMTSEQAALEKINNALAGQPQFFEWKHSKYDGTVFDAEVSLNRLDVNGETFIQAIVRDITQRKKTEADNLRLAMVANTTKNIVIIADADGRIEWVNQAFTTITEYSFNEVIGKKPGQLLQGPETDQTNIDLMSKKIAEGKGVKDLEIVNYTKSGKPYWVSLEVQPIFDASGKLNQFIAIESDITERKKTQLALADREKRFRNLVQQSPVAVIEWDTQLNVLEWNEAAEHTFGFSREEALNRSAFGLILPASPTKEISTVIHQLLTQQRGNRNTNSNITKSGKTIFCEWYNRPLTDDMGKVIGIVSMVEDITERLKVEKELKESELKFRQIIQSSPMGIYLYEVNADDQLILVDTNPAADIITGIQNTKLIGLTFEQAFPQLRLAEFVPHYLAAALHGIPWYKEDVFYNDGEVALAFQLHAFQAGYNRVAVMLLNISERKQIEDSIKQKNQELLKTNAELDRFVYSASHDLRAPIASLLGLINVARLEKTVEGINHLLKLQEKSLLRLDSFIKEIVDYSRNTRLKVESARIDFDTLVKNTFEQLHFMENVDRIRKVITIDQPAEVYSDPKRLEVIFNNIISNAIKYADVRKADPYIEVVIKGNSEITEISIKDNGEGIKQESLAMIFDMFYRASEHSSGSGLGLYIVAEAIQKLSGQITVQSEFSVGTEFKITIPNHVASPSKNSKENSSWTEVNS